MTRKNKPSESPVNLIIFPGGGIGRHRLHYMRGRIGTNKFSQCHVRCKSLPVIQLTHLRCGNSHLYRYGDTCPVPSVQAFLGKHLIECCPAYGPVKVSTGLLSTKTAARQRLTLKLNLNANFVKNTIAKIKNFFAPSNQLALALQS